MTVALWGLSAASEDGVTESDVILPLLRISKYRQPNTCFSARIDSIPETEEVSYFLLACVMTDVLHLLRCRELVTEALVWQSLTKQPEMAHMNDGGRHDG